MIVDKTTRAGSRSLTGRRHYGLGWLPWLLILVLLVLAAAILVVVANLDEETEAAHAVHQASHPPELVLTSLV
jgi:hypothetical protein